MYKAGVIGKNVFWPAPKINSGLVGFRMREEPLSTVDRDLVFTIIDAAFAQRRKTLRAALSSWAGSGARAEQILIAAGIAPTERGEKLDIHGFIRIAEASLTAISVDAPGKVNLYLAVGDVRPDGYHPLTTLFAAVSLTETVTVSEGQTQGLSLSMDIVPGSLVDQQMQAGQFDPADVPMDERNLVYRAAELILAEHGISGHGVESTPALHLHIAKAVPVAGGMAGGSADAAAALIATDR